MAIRLSLGAGSGGLMRVCLAESVLLAALGASAGVLVAHFAAGHLQDLVPPLPFPVKLTFRIGAPVLAAAVAAATVAALFCGAWCGLEARRQSASLRLRRERSRSRGVLVASQIAASFLLLSASAAFYRSIEKSRAADLGFDPRSISLDRVDLNGGRYTAAEARTVLQTALARIRETPGVETASLARTTPFGLGDQERATVAAGAASPQIVAVNRVSPGYFAMMGIRLAEGRDFSDADAARSAPVAIVNEALAARLWPHGSPIGRDLLVDGRRTRIAALVGTAKLWSLTDEAQACLYLPIWQSDARFATIHVKSRAGSAAIHRAVQRELERLDPALPVSPEHTMEQQVETAIFPQRVALVVLGIFAAAGMYLAVFGLFGVIAHAAQSRSGEIALRMALGATPGEVCRLMVRQASVLVLPGLGGGVLLAAMASPLLRSVLVGQSGIDLASTGATAGVIILAAVLATWLPTLRAMRVQPAAALRGD
jgi:predicted permease